MFETHSEYRHKTSSTASILGAAALILLALASLVGWATDNRTLIQIDPQFAPLHYNSGGALLLWGIGLFAITIGWNTVARNLGVTMVAIATVVLSPYCGSPIVGINRWWVVPDAMMPNFPPGGTHPITALSLAIAGCTLVLMGRRRITVFTGLLIALMGAILILGSLAILLASDMIVSRGQTLGPPLVAIFGLVIGGASTLDFAYRRNPDGAYPSYGQPLFVAICGIAGSLFFWHALNVQQNHRIQQIVQFEAAHANQILNETSPASFDPLVETMRRWNKLTPEEMKDRIDYFMAQHSGCLGVARMDPEHPLEWIGSPYVAKLPKSLDELGLGEHLPPLLSRNKLAAILAPRSRSGGARVLVVYLPFRSEAKEKGGLIACFLLKEWLDSILGQNLIVGYGLRITAQDQEIYGRLSSQSRDQEEWAQSLPIRCLGLKWQMHIWPTRELMERESLSLPKWALIVGLLTTALLTLAVHLARTARWRARELEKEICDRKQAEVALKQSEAKYRSLIENLEQGVFLKDADGRYVAVNASFARANSRTEAEFVGKTEVELFPGSVGQYREQEDRDVLTGGRKIEKEEEFEVEGRKRMIRRILTPVRDAFGQRIGVLGICWDVTEQRAIEARLRQTGKMDAIGQLAGGIAHDFNNLLTAIIGNLDLMLNGSQLPSRYMELVSAAQTAATRAASLTNRLLGFSRQHQLAWQPTDLNVVVEEVVTLLGRTIDPRIRLEMRCCSKIWPVLADASQINQVLMNLCLNARDAIDGAGRISIETATVEVGADTAFATPEDARIGTYVRLRVSDTGSGMSPEVASRIFEPFFTTKEVGKGTGLGLAMVFAIVKQHQGWIECHSKPGQGTTFDVFLPRTNSAPKVASPTPTPKPAQTQKHETILVVDDEPMIRKLASLVLQRSGYHILEAEDGLQAVELYGTHWQSIDLVLLDLTMPNLSGQEALRQMIPINPKVKALFASGYAAEQVTEEDQGRIVGFVKKPYRPDDLVANVQEALQRTPLAIDPDYLHPESVAVH